MPGRRTTLGSRERDYLATESALGGNATVHLYYATTRARSASDAAEAGLLGAVDVAAVDVAGVGDGDGDGAYFYPSISSVQFVHDGTVKAM